MTAKEAYDSLGADYEGALKRLMNDKILTKFAKKFIEDPSFSQIKPAIIAKDWATAFRMAHTLKGTSANVGLTNLTTVASALTEAMRGENGGPAKPLRDAKLYNDVVIEYNKTVNALKQID